jgi:hypothetical protein
MGYCTCLLLDAVGWICLLVMAHTRHAGIRFRKWRVMGVWSKILGRYQSFSERTLMEGSAWIGLPWIALL